MPEATILIVEDEVIVATDLARKLARLGYTVCGSTDCGEDALALTREHCPDLVLMDIHLAGAMDGVTAVDQLRRECDVPVIYLTAHTDRATLDRAKHTESFGYILKPFEERELESHIEMALYKHQIEHKLRESEIRFRAVQENSLDRITILKPFYNDIGEMVDFTYVYQNARAASTARRSPEEQVGRRMTENFATFPRTRFFAIYKQVVETGQALEFEERYDSDGVDDWFRAAVTPVPGGIAVATQIITERKRAEETLRVSEAKFRGLFNGINVAIQLCELVWDEEGRPIDNIILDVSPAYEEQSGLSRHQVVGRRIKEILSVVEQVWLDRYAEMLRTRHPMHFEEYNAALARWFDVYASPLQDNQFVAAFTDITARKQAEEALRESEARFRSVLDNSQDVIYRMNTQTGHFEYISPSAATVVGYSPDELRAADTETALAMIHPDDLPAMRAAQVRLEETGKAEVEYRQRAKSGDYRWISNHMSLTRDSTGQPLYRDGNIRDVTERKQIEAALLAADRAKDEFLAVISHELQTPLTNMLGWSTEALRVGTPELMAKAMEVVHRNAVRQKRLVLDILDMSRLIHRKIELVPEPTDLWVQASQAVENVQHAAVGRQLHLLITPQADPLPIYADPARLQQCIGNLLNNSLKFTPQGGKITLSCHRDGEQAVLAITDTGCGIDPAALPTLFQVFRQVDRDERHGGLGLGLAVTHGIIKLHGGSLTADSPGKDRGSSFSIILPIANYSSA